MNLFGLSPLNLFFIITALISLMIGVYGLYLGKKQSNKRAILVETENGDTRILKLLIMSAFGIALVASIGALIVYQPADNQEPLNFVFYLNMDLNGTDLNQIRLEPEPINISVKGKVYYYIIINNSSVQKSAQLSGGSSAKTTPEQNSKDTTIWLKININDQRISSGRSCGSP